MEIQEPFAYLSRDEEAVTGLVSPVLVDSIDTIAMTAENLLHELLARKALGNDHVTMDSRQMTLPEVWRQREIISQITARVVERNLVHFLKD